VEGFRRARRGAPSEVGSGIPPSPSPEICEAGPPNHHDDKVDSDQ